MTGIDIALCVILIVGCIAGYREGFLMSLFSLLAIVLGVLGGFKLLGWAMILIDDEFDLDDRILPYVAFATVFLGIVIVVRLVGNMIKLTVDRTFLGRIDQFAGAVLGFFKTLFIASVLLWLADSLHLDFPEKWAKDSIILPYVVDFAPMVAAWVGGFFPFFEDVFG